MIAGSHRSAPISAKSMAEKIDPADVQRTWTKINNVENRTPKKAAGLAALAADTKASPLDKPPIEAQLVGATILERQAKPLPAEAKTDIAAMASDSPRLTSDVGRGPRDGQGRGTRAGGDQTRDGSPGRNRD